METISKELVPNIALGLAACIVRQIESGSRHFDLIEKSMDTLMKKCVEFCLRGCNLGHDATFAKVTSKVIKVYTSLVRDIRCLSEDVFLSFSNLVSILLVKHIEKSAEKDESEAADILQTLVGHIQS